MSKKTDRGKLRKFQALLDNAVLNYKTQLEQMPERRELYAGDNTIRRPVKGGGATETDYVNNMAAELVESQVSPDVPQPKVTALRKQDEWLASLIEDFLRLELQRLGTETMLDLSKRECPGQGGVGWHTPWDDSVRSADTVGANVLELLEPEKLIPQHGVYEIEDMDYVFLRIPQTVGGIWRRYGVDVSQEQEEAPQLRGEDYTISEDGVTLNIAYYREDDGAVSKFSWVGETVVEDITDYLARRLPVCVACGAPEPDWDEELPPTTDGTRPDGREGAELPDDVILPTPRSHGGSHRKRACPHCGGTKWEERPQEFEEIWVPVHLETPEGIREIPGAQVVDTGEVLADENGVPMTDEQGNLLTRKRYEPTRIPWYKPKLYPVVVQRNTSAAGKFLGSSDLDKLSEQQNEMNRLTQQINEKLHQFRGVIVRPPEAKLKLGPSGIFEMVIEKPDEAAMIRAINLQLDISQDLVWKGEIYEDGRRAIGVNDAFQGRRDPTATSGIAKEFSANQAAGRMASKRVMENAAFAQIFERWFQNVLAYADEPRPVVSRDADGGNVYREFNRYYFLEYDEDSGQWRWNDRFLFGVDSSANLAGNREAMWRELLAMFQAGAMGDPKDIGTQIHLWGQLELQHYPGAAANKNYLEEKQKRMEAQAMQMQAAQTAMMNQTPAPMPVNEKGELP